MWIGFEFDECVGGGYGGSGGAMDSIRLCLGMIFFNFFYEDYVNGCLNDFRMVFE